MGLLTTTFRVERLKADLRTRGWTPTDLVRVLVAKDAPDEQYVFDQTLYMRQWARVNRFLAGQSSVPTARAIAAALGYQPTRYIAASAIARKHGIH